MTFKLFKSFHIWAVYQINYSQTFNVVIFSHLEELKRDLSDYGVIIRDKVGNFGQLDGKTLFGNKSNLHTKIAFTLNISR